MNAPATIERDPQVTDFLEEIAEQIAREEHSDLEYRRDCIFDAWRGGTSSDEWRRDSFDEDHGFRADFGDYFEKHKAHYIQQATEWLQGQLTSVESRVAPGGAL